MLIDNELILLNLKTKSLQETIEKMAQKAYKQGRINNIEKYVEAVLKREEEYSTAVGFGVAIPHGKTDAVNEPFLMFATVEPLDWKALDDKPVDLIFLIGVPMADAGSLHLKILSNISRKLMKEEFRTALRNIKSEEELIELLKANDVGL